MKRNTLLFLVFFVCGMIFCFNCSEAATDNKPGRKKYLTVAVCGITLKVELALTPLEQLSGLMHRDSLEENEGMLFVFPSEQILSFWMKDTSVPISIAFIKEDGRIIQIESMEPLSMDMHVSKEKVKYALEMKEGWFNRHNVKVGHRINIPAVAAGISGD